MAPHIRRTGPHIESRESVRRTMWREAVALLPPTVAAVIFFGPYSLYLVFISAIAAAVLERPFAPGGFSWSQPLGDGSAFLAGMVFGLTLAPGSPWWIPLLGAAILVFIGKQAFGGLGHNIFNPALVARGILLLAYPALLTEWRVPLQFDAVTAATPLGEGTAPYFDLLIGNVAGSIGETSVIAILIGGVYLAFRGFVGWRITVAYIVSAALAALALGIDPIFTVLSGGLVYAAFYMATDMVTSPTGRSASVVYGIGCGVLTVVLREFTVFPGAVTFAVLAMNGVTPILDVTVVDTFFGQAEKRRRRILAGAAAVVLIALGTAAGLGSAAAGGFASSYYVDGTTRRDIRAFFEDEGGRYAVPVDAEREGVTVERVYSRDAAVGYLVYSSADGYAGPIRMAVALDNRERVVGLRVVDHNESPTLGGLVRRPSFLNQFLRRSTARPGVSEHAVAVTGATISSRAVARAVEEALRFNEARERPPARLELTDGVFRGSAGGYQARIAVAVTVQNREITDIEVIEHRETPRLADGAFSRLREAIIERQGLDVDVVSGATGTSRGYINAIRDALSE